MAFHPNTAKAHTSVGAVKPKNKYYDKEAGKWTSREDGGEKGQNTPANGAKSNERGGTSKSHGNRFSLPYGLCEGLGINTDGMTPREAWDAYMNATGKSKTQAENEHWEKTADGQKQSVTLENPQADKSIEPKQETLVNANETAETETQPTQEQSVESGREETNEETSKAKYYDIDEKRARIAHENYSFSDYKEGSTTNEYRRRVDSFNEEVEKLKKQYKDKLHTPEDLAAVDRTADAYARKLAEYYNDTNKLDAGHVSWAISGPANYNMRKHEQYLSRMSALHKDTEKSGILESGYSNPYLRKIRDTLSNASVQSSDSAAMEKLQTKLDGLKQSHEAMKGAMAYYRKNGTFRGFEHPGISAETLSKEEDFIKRNGWGGFNLMNSSAEIRRTQSRIDELNKVKAGAEAAKANPEAAAQATAAKYPKVDGVRVVENADLMRIQLKFDGRPDRETTDKLKHNGFRWSPSQGSWQRQLNSNGEFAAKRILKELGGKKE